MKTIAAALLCLLPWCASAATEREPVELRELAITGTIDGDNIVFDLAFTARVNKVEAVLPLVTGPVALLDAPKAILPDLRREAGGYVLACPATGDRAIALRFAAQATRAEDALMVRLVLPVAPLRRVSVQCDREDLDVRFEGALDVKREKNAGGALVTAVLPPTAPLVVRWQPKVRRLAGELVLECDVNEIVAARAGALRVDSLFNFRIAQGALSKLAFDVPEGRTVTQVRGADVREWAVEQRDAKTRVLSVTLSRPQEKTYQLHVEHERPLPPLPCEIELAPLAPRDVLRASGFMLAGADGAMRLIVKKAAGLTQIDRAAFASTVMQGTQRLAAPQRESYAYQFANLPYALSLSAEDVVTSLQAEERLVLGISDNDISLEATVDADVRDAAARELVIETDPAWNVTAVEGQNVADSDVKDENGVRKVRVYLRTAALGRQLVNLRLERTLPANATSFPMPVFRLAGARSERGYVALRGELGVTLRPAKEDGLREVPTASLPVKVPGAQYAARFKAQDWKLDVAIVREQASIGAEIFDLATFGESAVYGSSLVTYLINGAPVRTLRLAIPPAWRNIEVTGRDVRSWRKEAGTCVVSLQEKVVGDYTLLVTYDVPVPYAAGELQAGGLRALDAANEGGYLALAAPPGVALVADTNRPAGLLTIAADELPPEYAVMIKDPVLRAYKYAAGPQAAGVSFQRYTAKDLLDHVADLVLLNSRLSEEGEIVTDLSCQVKNASRQYLGVTLPAGARLWSVAVDGQKAQALERGAGKILIPLPRRLDPNEPTRVDVSCASQAGKIGQRQTLALTAPALDARSIYARWTVTPPDRYEIASASGDLTPPKRPGAGLRALAEQVGRVALGWFTSASGWIALGAILVGFVALLLFNVARGKPQALSTWMGCTVAICATAAAIATLPFAPRAVSPPVWTESAVQQIPQQQGADPSMVPSTSWTMSKPVTLAEGGLRVDVTVERKWIGVAVAWMWPIAGLALLVVSFIKARRVPLVFGLNVAVALAAAAQNPAVVPPLAGCCVAAVLLALGVGVVRGARNAGRVRYVAPLPPLPPPEVAAPADAGSSGRIDLRMLFACAAASLLAVAALAAEPAKPVASEPAKSDQTAKATARGAAAPASLVPTNIQPLRLAVSRVVANVELPGPTTDGMPPADANVELTIAFEAKEAGDYLLLPGRYVLTSFTSTAKDLEVVARDGGYWLRVGTAKKSGWFSRASTAGQRSVTIRYRALVTDARGGLETTAWLPPHLANEVTVKLPSPEWTVESPAAAFLKVGELGTAQLVAATNEIPLAWKPRTRIARLEKASFFAELQTIARLRPGLVSLTHFVRYQIAQGELQTLRCDIPAGATVTAVSGSGLGTWRFDPATRLLEAVLEKPVSGSYALRVVTQVAREGLPYEAELREIIVREAASQRGVIALVADAGVQVSANPPEGAAPMAPGDIPADALARELEGYPELSRKEVDAGAVLADVKRAYRYQQTPVTLRVNATRVEAELRATEDARVDITDERVVLSSRLQIDIAKAGIFTVWLELPEGFDIDALSGDDVSHWDEAKDGGAALPSPELAGKGATAPVRSVAVHFIRQAQGLRNLNVVLSRQEKSRLDEIELPRIGVRGALKHTGALAVSTERGLRATTVKREGATELNPRDIGIQQTGFLAFRLLRPDWALRLKVETALPVVKAEVVQRVTVSEGMMQARCRVIYAIEHAGVKTFRLRAPQPGVALVVTGPNLARVQQADLTNGVWELELTSKREGSVSFDVTYQAPYDASAGKAAIRSLVCEDVDSQKGWFAVFAGGRLEVKSEQAVEGVETEDPRAVPARLGAGDLSGAALCFRATKGGVELPLVITRHETADLLAARVRSADITTVLTEDGAMATLASLKLDNSNLRFLRAKLPAGADVWSAFVNGRAVKPLTEGDRLLIPMTSASAGATEVELTYGSKLAGATSHKEVPGPAFDLPLQNVTWRMYVPPGAQYRGFGGTLIYREELSAAQAVFSPENYEQVNRLLAADNTKKAVQILQQGQELSKAGRNDMAKQALEEAIAYSQGDRSLNEDARIQFKSLARQQAVAGIAARRSAMKVLNNAATAEDVQQTLSFNGGNYSADFGAQVQQRLGAKESDSLSLVADKLLEQQVAAGGEVHPVRVTLPAEGRLLTFTRELQVQPDAEMMVEFVAGSGALVRWSITGGIALGFLLLFGLSARLAFGRS